MFGQNFRTTQYIGYVVSGVPHHNLNPEPKKLHIIPPPPPTSYSGDPFPKGSEVRSQVEGQKFKPSPIIIQTEFPSSCDRNNQGPSQFVGQI